MSLLRVDQSSLIVEKIFPNEDIPEELDSNDVYKISSRLKDSNNSRDDRNNYETADQFDIQDIPNVPKTTFNEDKLGKRALATLKKQQSLTYKKLEQLHGSLISRPAEDQKEKDPKGLKIPLMPHQQHALAWMKWRELQEPKGGILGTV